MLIARFLLRRALLVVPLLLAVVFFTFMLVRIGGQDPVARIAGPTATQGEIEMIRGQLGLDRPLLVQFATYLNRVAHGDLGRSWISNRPVLSDVLDRIPVTLELMLLGVALGALIAIPAGLFAASRPNRMFDQLSRGISLLGFSIPTYWLALVMLFVFFYLLDWAPPGMGRLALMLSPPPRVTGSYLIDGLLAADWEVAYSAAAQLVLPVLSVAIVAAAPIIKQTRAIALEVSASDYVRYARAAGLPRRQIHRMVLRNSRTPVITFVGTELTGLVGTTALIEYVFAWGGLGQYGLNAIIAGDFVAIQGYVLTLALFSVIVFVVVDLLVLLLEPRAALRA